MQNKIVIVTGASEGIGRALTRLLVSRGAKVAAIGRRQSALDALVEELGDAVLPLSVDVSDHTQTEAAVQEVLAKWGRIDALVNNAGVGRYAPVHELSYEDWALQINVNLTGTFNCCKAVLPHMLERSESTDDPIAGQILNMCSEVGYFGVATRGGYCASKFGIRGLTECLRLEAQPKRIRVMHLSPGMVMTNFAGRPKETKAGFLKPETIAWQIYTMLTTPEDALPASSTVLSMATFNVNQDYQKIGK
ncbi:MAG: SDR family oxidoreductase [Eubacterium sp.]|nr:SDR family oxidoreductase [Eubacterium sp.]